MDFDDDYPPGMDFGPGPSRPRSPPSSNAPGGRTPRRAKKQPPQDTIRQFWDKFNTKYPGKVFTVLPDNPYAKAKAAKTPKGVVQGDQAVRSYEQARKGCENDVRKIAKECRRVNQKYRDPHFDIEYDLKSRQRDCLDGLDRADMGMMPRAVKRATEIFENPQFYVNGPTAGDVRQGRDGDCWLMAALCTLGNKEGLIDRICVDRDEQVGVYGFVFHRDGEWQQCVIDDKLYLRAADYDESTDERQVWDDINRNDPEEEYRKTMQTGSRALYFAQCSDENETWLPLLEKAFAKAHGDYYAIDGGFVGEAIEDLTGGVTTEIFSSNILDKEKFWKEELMKCNKEFLFGCATGFFSNWLDPHYEGPPRERKGISEGHAYSIMEAREVKGKRLLRLRNPWGKKEWNGAWSDGSEQWTSEWMNILGHKFGNDGVFWMTYEDLLKKYQYFDRTRLFGPEWTITQQWTSVNVPWSADYHDTKFEIVLTKKSPVVIVLSQLDNRYFYGLEGEYDFKLQFRVENEGDEDGDYIVRSNANYAMNRSVSTDIELEAGTYSVLMKITAVRNSNRRTPEEVVRACVKDRREKLVQIGLSYDLAHAKGRIVESEKEQLEREQRQARKKAAARKKLRDELEKRKLKEWNRQKKFAARQKRAQTKAETIAQKRMTRSEILVSEPQSMSVEDGDMGEEGAAHPVSEEVETRPENKAESDALAADSSSQRRITPEGPIVESLDSFLERHPETEIGEAGVPEIRVNDKATLAKESAPAPPGLPPSTLPTSSVGKDQNDEDESDLDSFHSFEFDSELDMPSEDDEPTPQPPPDLSDGPPDEFESDPWNAVCVVGLRVYSMDSELSLQVIRPKNEDEGEAPLDRDDPAKAAASKCAESVIYGENGSYHVNGTD